MNITGTHCSPNVTNSYSLVVTISSLLCEEIDTGPNNQTGTHLLLHSVVSICGKKTTCVMILTRNTHTHIWRIMTGRRIETDRGRTDALCLLVRWSISNEHALQLSSSSSSVLYSPPSVFPPEVSLADLIHREWFSNKQTLLVYEWERVVWTENTCRLCLCMYVY